MFCYYSLGDDTATLSGLYAGLCHAFLDSSQHLKYISENVNFLTHSNFLPYCVYLHEYCERPLSISSDILPHRLK